MLACTLSASFAQKRVVLDNFYNNEFDSKSGKSFHYLWEDSAMSGFSEFGKLFTNKGALLSVCKEKPTFANLKSADLYIIVDPDNQLETAHPNFMDKTAPMQLPAGFKREVCCSCLPMMRVMPNWTALIYWLPSLVCSLEKRCCTPKNQNLESHAILIAVPL
jgi:hypothetical protein